MEVGGCNAVISLPVRFILCQIALYEASMMRLGSPTPTAAKDGKNESPPPSVSTIVQENVLGSYPSWPQTPYRGKNITGRS